MLLGREPRARAGGPEAVRAFAERARRQGRRCSSIVGEAGAVGLLWSCCAPRGARRGRCARHSRCSCSPARRPCRRPARTTGGAAEVDVLLPACVAMFTEEVGVSPLAGDGGALYRARVQELVAQGRAFARIEGGRVLFKAEIGAATPGRVPGAGRLGRPGAARARPGTARLRGRRRAVARADVAPVVSLYVNDFNAAARRSYEKVGFVQRRAPGERPVLSRARRRRRSAAGPGGRRHDRRQVVRPRPDAHGPSAAALPEASMTQLKPGTSWDEVYARARAAAPEAFETDRILNLADGEWRTIGDPGPHVTPVDGSGSPGAAADQPRRGGVGGHAAKREHDAWQSVDLDERQRRVAEAVAEHAPSTATRSRCCWCGRSASRGSWPAPTSTARSTASTGTSARSSGSCRAGARCPGR